MKFSEYFGYLYNDLSIASAFPCKMSDTERNSLFDSKKTVGQYPTRLRHGSAILSAIAFVTSVVGCLTLFRVVVPFCADTLMENTHSSKTMKMFFILNLLIYV